MQWSVPVSAAARRGTHSGTRHAGIARIAVALASLAGVAAIAGALALAPATRASAHDYLVDSSPKAGSVQSTPISQVSLTFNDVILDLSGDGSSTLVQVTGPGSQTTHFETGCPKAVDRVVTAPVALGGAGKYTVTYQIVSADGHTVSSALTFTYRPPAGTAAAPGTSAGPGCGTSATKPGGSTSAATARPNPSNASNDSGNLGIVIGIGVVIVALAIIGVVVILLASRKKPGKDGSSRDSAPPDGD